MELTALETMMEDIQRIGATARLLPLLNRHHSDAFSTIMDMVEQMKRGYAENFGPLLRFTEMNVRTPQELGVGVDLFYCFDDNSNRYHNKPFTTFAADREKVIQEAAAVYSAEIGLADPYVPNSGLCILRVIPVASFGTHHQDSSNLETWRYTANLVGFAALRDANEDGDYDTVEHFWVAKTQRRKKIATELIAKAKYVGAYMLANTATDTGKAVWNY